MLLPLSVCFPVLPFFLSLALFPCAELFQLKLSGSAKKDFSYKVFYMNVIGRIVDLEGAHNYCN